MKLVYSLTLLAVLVRISGSVPPGIAANLGSGLTEKRYPATHYVAQKIRHTDETSSTTLLEYKTTRIGDIAPSMLFSDMAGNLTNLYGEPLYVSDTTTAFGPSKTRVWKDGYTAIQLQLRRLSYESPKVTILYSRPVEVPSK